ncbi:cold-shock DNA-binding protein family [Roseivivax lentus]|uniref:Cold-shock DNA-binding protein family n=1 Tax=Roseivivax lentus TaxID=633194 RepID=A0A1N7MRK6_9RHOB|nr:cold shock domain-containing protein [Roseivivax lentus]SIS88763.1 cold-shock DNA-binding protein family [Roseivivax lentus]
MQTDHGETRVLGTVKWFDPGKGFGFVVADHGGRDILLHANVLRNFGQSSVADAARVEISVQETPRGFQATAVHMILPPVEDTTPPLADFEDMSPEVLAAAKREPARVKWFDKSKGFGFANVFGSDEDVFIHIEVLRRSGLADLLPGEAIVLRVVQGKRGRMATEISSWESAVER